MNDVQEFNDYRSRMNEKILSFDNLLIKRIFNLDSLAYQEGKLDSKTKELLGLGCSLVLRCDDCVRYHLEKCHELGIDRETLMEALSIGTLVGGTIVIPHLRRAVDFLDELEKHNVSERS